MLLGENDTDPNDADLRSTPEADRQGPAPTGRAQFFFEAGRATALALGTPFGWRLETVPGAARLELGNGARRGAVLFAG